MVCDDNGLFLALLTDQNRLLIYDITKGFIFDKMQRCHFDIKQIILSKDTNILFAMSDKGDFVGYELQPNP